MSPEIGILVGVVLAALAVFLVTRPFRERVIDESGDETELANLLAQREAAYTVLRDLDNDYQTGKLAEDDYRPLRVQALAQAAEIVAQIDAYETRAASSARAATSAADGRAHPRRTAAPQSRRRRSAPASTPDVFCPRCGARHAVDDAYCRKCGASLDSHPADGPEGAPIAEAASDSGDNTQVR